jgi:hypothetical protein
MSSIPNRLMNYYTISSNADPGVTDTVTAVVDSVVLNGGLYKIAAQGSPLNWKLGSTDVTATTGAYLAAGDQEVIYVSADNTKLSWIRASDATADGYINYVPVLLMELPGGDLRNLI